MWSGREGTLFHWPPCPSWDCHNCGNTLFQLFFKVQQDNFGLQPRTICCLETHLATQGSLLRPLSSPHGKVSDLIIQKISAINTPISLTQQRDMTDLCQILSQMLLASSLADTSRPAWLSVTLHSSSIVWLNGV